MSSANPSIVSLEGQSLAELDHARLEALEARVAAHYETLKARGLSLDVTRGKPSGAQLSLSNALDGILEGDFEAADGTDVRGYGGPDGIAEARELGAQWLGVPASAVIVGNNSSLELMYLFILRMHVFGIDGYQSAWRQARSAKFLCPVPGYDRHFAVCESVGLELVPVPMTDEGPDMDRVEALVGADPDIKGMWCVPKYSNPTGATYSEATARRIAGLAKLAGEHFRVIWDNAYEVHDLYEQTSVPDIWALCEAAGTLDSVVLIGSTSKVTFAGGGMAFFAGSQANLAAMRTQRGLMTIGPDKVNQLRHVRWLKDMGGVRALMSKHAEILRPKFEAVEQHLQQGLGGTGAGEWTKPRGGYFVSFDGLPGTATETVRLAAEAGVKLTPAGAAFPYGKDPDDRNIRLAPSFPPLEEVRGAMEVFVTSAQLASVRKLLRRNA